ncbi:MAG: energy-coupling factor transporter transmembrane protein EcfT [Spirochaetia bacterium]|nr:energy-coupling factor transporter transmembrane protein EcfT [Spirochaetia bacterium]
MKKPFLYLADPRLKLILVMLYTAAFFCPVSATRYALLLVPVLISGFITCGFRQFLSVFKLILPLIILTAILTPLFSGIHETVRIILRFIGITALFFLYFKTTDSDEFIQTLRFFGMPYRLALVISISTSYIPLLLETWHDAQAAHKLRYTENCPEVSRWNFIARFCSILPVLSSVLIQAVKSIPTLAMALEIRGVGKAKPTVFRPIQLKKPLYLQLLLYFIPITVIILILVIYAA